jgi:hypothetical protein
VLYAYLVNGHLTMVSTIDIVGTTNITHNTSITSLFSTTLFLPEFFEHVLERGVRLGFQECDYQARSLELSYTHCT